MKKIFLIVAGVVVLSLALTSHSQASTLFISSTDQQGSASLSSPSDNDAMLVGSVVSVTAPVGGELFAAGNTVSITKSSGRSIFVAGNVVSVDGGSAYNTFAAGNTVILSGTYGHDVYAAGSTVTIKDGTVINGDLRISGNVVTLGGTVKGSVFASGAQTTSSAVVGGSFSGHSGTLSFSGGSIGRDLSYQSKADATGLSSVSILGKTQRSDPPEPTKAPAYAGVMGLLVSLLSVLILGAALIIYAPQKIESFLNESPQMWTKWAGLGAAVLVLVPIAIAVAFATVIGWEVALVLLLIYVIGILIAHVYAYIYLGQSILNRFAKHRSLWAYLVVGAISLYVFVGVPFLGSLLSLAFFVTLVLPAFGFLASGLRKQL